MDGNSLPVTSARENEDGFWNVPHLSLQIPFLLHLREHLSFPHCSLPFLLMYYQQFKHKHYSITPRGSPRKTLNCSFRLQHFHWMHHKEQINFVSEYYSYPALLQAPPAVWAPFIHPVTKHTGSTGTSTQIYQTQIVTGKQGWHSLWWMRTHCHMQHSFNIVLSNTTCFR